MSVPAAHAAPRSSQYSIAGAVIHWGKVRLAVYLITPLVSIAVFAAGATFYRYVWPGRRMVTDAPIVLPKIPQPGPVSTRTPAPSPASLPNAQVPEPDKVQSIGGPVASVSQPRQSLSTTSAGASPHAGGTIAYVAAPPGVENMIGNALPIAEVVTSLPEEWHVVGVEVVDIQGGVIGNVQGVQVESGTQEVVVRLNDTKTVSVQLADIGWLPNENGSSPVIGVLYNDRFRR